MASCKQCMRMFILTWLPEMNKWIGLFKISLSLVVCISVHYHKIIPHKKTTARIIRKTPTNLVISINVNVIL